MIEKTMIEVFNFIDCRGKSPNKQKSGIPLLTAKNVKNGYIKEEPKEFLSEFQYDEWIKRGVPKEGDLLFTTEAPLGNVAVLPFYDKVVVAQRVICLSPKLPCNTSYYKWYILAPQFQGELNRRATGSTAKGIRSKELAKIKIPLPPLPQQKKIAAILDAADAYRQKTKALITKYDALTQSLFLDMFGDPVRNPKGWEVKKLKELSTNIHSGNTPKGGSKVYVKQGITFFRSQNVWKNNIIYKDIAFIDQATHDKMLKSSLKNGDILMTKTGRINTKNSSLGRAAMYVGEDNKANVNGHVYFIRLKKGVINEFILHILTTKEYRGHIRRVCVGGIDKRQLNKNHIEDFPIINPPISMQAEYINKMDVLNDHKSKLKLSLAKSEDLFKSLLQKAFKGELV